MMLNPELGVRRDQMTDYAYLRATGLGLAGQFGMPRPSRSQLESYIRERMIFQDRESGEFSAESYNQMLSMLETGTQFSRDGIARVLREDWQIAQVRRMLGGPGVELPWEQRQNYIARETEFDVVVARANFDDFRPDLDADVDELVEFYEAHSEEYEEPRKIRVTALFFRPENFTDHVEIPDESVLRTYFDNNRFIYEAERERADDGEPLPPLTLDEVRSEVIEDYRSEQAWQVAEQRSEAFTLELWEQEIERDSEAFDRLLDDYRAETEQLEPYARNRALSHPEIGRQVLESMWMYATESSRRYFSDISELRGGGAVVLVFDEVIPERLPPFEEVADDVEYDWVRDNRRRLFSEYGEELYADLNARLEEGTGFIEAAEELDLAVEDPDPFKGNEAPDSLARSQAWQQNRYLGEGAVSRMSIERSEGVFIYIRSRSVPDVDFESESFQAFIDRQQDGLGEAKGWSRLQEVTDARLSQVMGTGAADMIDPVR